VRYAREHPQLLAVLAVGVLARAVLLPITHGQDFVVWDKASAATLRGINVYAHHPDYPGGPYAYFPLFLYIELPFRWLADVTGAPFTVLGKLPIMAGDVVAAAALAAELVRRRCAPRVVAIGTALFFLNPLVLYNGAFYGRFDSVGLALLLLAFYGLRPQDGIGRRSALLYAAAVAAKTFPVFIAPKLLTAGRTGAARVIVAGLAVVGGISLPYLLSSPQAFVTDVLLYDAKKLPQGLSWQQVYLGQVGHDAARWVSYLLLALFVLSMVGLVRIPDLATYTLLGLLLFLLFSKVVLEQYLIWPLPWLILRGLDPVRRPALGMLALLSTVGMLVNPYIHPFGQQPLAVAVLLGVALAGYALGLAWQSWRPGQTRTTAPSALISETSGSSNQRPPEPR
jgi:uncharacterized membrane protein